MGRRRRLGAGKALPVGLDDRGADSRPAEVESENGGQRQEGPRRFEGECALILAKGMFRSDAPDMERPPPKTGRGRFYVPLRNYPPILKTFVPHFGQVP
jgi:hypothetical protein